MYFNNYVTNIYCCWSVAWWCWLFVSPWKAAHHAPLSSAFSRKLLRFMSIELVMLSNHLVLYCPLLLMPSVLPSISSFSDTSAFCIRWPKYWSFNFSNSPSNEYSELISFRTDWFDLLAVHRISRVYSSDIIQKHQFFGAQLVLWSKLSDLPISNSFRT